MDKTETKMEAGSKKISAFFKKFNLNKNVESERDVNEEEGSPSRDAVSRIKKRVTFFGRNNNVEKKTSNESRQTSNTDDAKNVKNVDNRDHDDAEDDVDEDGDGDDDESERSSGDEEKIKKMSEETTTSATKASQHTNRVAKTIAKFGEKRSKACTII